MSRLCAITLIFFCLSFQNLHALSPEQHLADDKQEQRAMKLFLEVRCLVCQGQVIENSSTEFSLEMRKLIRQKIYEGATDEEIRNDLVKEFGSDILVYSDFRKENFLLWLLPAVIAIAIPLFIIIRRNKSKID